MYVWIGFDVDSQLKALKRKSLEAEAQAQFRVQGSTLPLHISLKMPFEAADAPRLDGCAIDGRALLMGVLLARRQLGSNVSWPNALENMYFQLTDTGNNGRTKLSWQR